MPKPTPELWRRLAVTVAAPIAVFFSDFVQIPIPRDDRYPFQIPSLGVFELGLVPIIAAFIIVELVALAIPRLRPLRIGGTAARARLARWSLVVGLVLAGVQAFSLTYAAGIYGLRNHLIFGGLMIAGTAVLVLTAKLVSRFGLGNGFSVVLVSGVVVDLARQLTVLIRDVSDGFVTAMGAGFAVLIVAAFGVATARLLRRGGKGRASSNVVLRLPLCGVAPVLEAASLAAVFSTLANFGVDTSRIAAALTPGSPAYFWWLAAGIAVFGTAYALLFHRIGNVTRVFRQLGRVSDDAGFTNELRLARWRGVVTSCAFLFAYIVVAQFPFGNWSLPGRALFQIGSAIILPAVVLDLIDEWRARRAHGELASVWPEHRLYAVDPIVESLRSANISAFPRGVYHRTLLQFFGPVIPVDIMVPSQRVTDARSLVEEKLGRKSA
ncbi:MAG: hypothetical protein HYY84_08105 [Deltaproteobacteria bacterium]|nr:hypothetical protein [Deltaproteobacteria bacterium]